MKSKLSLLVLSLVLIITCTTSNGSSINNLNERLHKLMRRVPQQKLKNTTKRDIRSAERKIRRAELIRQRAAMGKRRRRMRTAKPLTTQLSPEMQLKLSPEMELQLSPEMELQQRMIDNQREMEKVEQGLKAIRNEMKRLKP